MFYDSSHEIVQTGPCHTAGGKVVSVKIINGEYDPDVMRDMINENRRQLGMEPMRHTFTQLQYSTDIKGGLALYVYEKSGFHRGPQYFRRVVRYPGEEITVAKAHSLADRALSEKREVRITNSGDILVFHSKDGQVLYPDNPARFWEECG